MLTLYSGSGSVSFSIGVAFLGEAEWFKLRAATVKLLTVRESREAGESLLWFRNKNFSWNERTRTFEAAKKNDPSIMPD